MLSYQKTLRDHADQAPDNVFLPFRRSKYWIEVSIEERKSAKHKTSIRSPASQKSLNGTRRHKQNTRHIECMKSRWKENSTGLLVKRPCTIRIIYRLGQAVLCSTSLKTKLILGIFALNEEKCTGEECDLRKDWKMCGCTRDSGSYISLIDVIINRYPVFDEHSNIIWLVAWHSLRDTTLCFALP